MAQKTISHLKRLINIHLVLNLITSIPLAGKQIFA